MGKRRTYRIHLDTGQTLSFQGSGLVTVRDSKGQPTAFNFADCVGDVPAYLDVTRVVAVTRDVDDEDDGGDSK